MVDLNPPKSTKKRKTVASEKAQELSEMNKRRVEALENIGESCKLATTTKQQSVQSSFPLEVKKEPKSADKAADYNETQEDEIKMWKCTNNRDIHEKIRKCIF